jgi:Transposase zinc-ribbon domain
MMQMTDCPRSLIEFQQRFCDEAACVEYLFAARWPAGFVCPGCGQHKAWQLQTKPWTPAFAGAGFGNAPIAANRPR